MKVLTVDKWRNYLEGCYSPETNCDNFRAEILIPDSTQICELKKQCASDTFSEVLALYAGTGDASDDDNYDSADCEFLHQDDRIDHSISKLSQIEVQNIQAFCDSLPSCLPFHHHFKFVDGKGDNKATSYCPCSKSMKHWRKEEGLNFLGDHNQCTFSSSQSASLTEHLRTKKTETMWHRAAYLYHMKVTVGWNNINQKERKVASGSSSHSSSHHNRQGCSDCNHRSRCHNNYREMPQDNRAPPL